MAQTIDENLLEYPGVLDRKGEQNAAGELKRRKASKEESAQEEKPKTLRERVMAARQAMDIKQRAKEKIKEKVTMPVRMGTNHALRWAWLTLIPSWGLTLIYINMHIFLRWVFPSAFCKLGEEWKPKIVGTGEHSAQSVAGTAFGIVEVMGLVLLDLLALFLILGIITIFIMLADVAAHPAREAWSFAWGWVGDVFKAILGIE